MGNKRRKKAKSHCSCDILKNRRVEERVTIFSPPTRDLVMLSFDTLKVTLSVTGHVYL